MTEESSSSKKHKKTRRAKTCKPATLNIQEEERVDSYSLFEEEPPPPGSPEAYRGRSRTASSVAGSSFMSDRQSDGIIDGRDFDPEFVNVDIPHGYGEDASNTTRNLSVCKKTVLTPYRTFLKVIGWHRIRLRQHDLEQPWWVRLLNVVYPSAVFLLLAFTSVTQILTCFRRVQPVNNAREEDGVLIVNCSSHVVTALVVPDILLLAAYLFGLYLFRYGEPEHIQTLMETAFLSYSSRQVKNSQQRLITTLRIVLFGGLVWVIFSASVSVMRVFSLQLLADNSYIEWLTFQDLQNLSGPALHRPVEDGLRFSFVIFSIFGFVCFDLLYVAVVINYTSQGQLLLYYIRSIIDRVRNKAYRLGDAVRDIRHSYDFLQVMNGKLAKLTSLILFIALTALIFSVVSLHNLDSDRTPNQRILHLGIAVGVCNIIQWTFLSLVPIIQASRLTSTCRKLRRLGLEIGARPFIYSDTPQLVLDSFLQYTDSTRYTAKLASIPMYPSYVVGSLFIIGLVAIYVIGAYPIYRFATWF